MNRKEEIKKCNMVKAILMLLVVLYHSCRIFGGGWGPLEINMKSPQLGVFAEWLNSFHIYGFTLISGYIFYFLKYEQGRYTKYNEFIIGKIKRLLIPYIFISIVWAIPVQIYFYGTTDVIENYFLGINPSQLWFLLMLFWVFVFFWPISDLVFKHPLIGGLIIIVAYMVGIISPNYFKISTGLQYIVFFYIGFMIRKESIWNKCLYRVPTVLYFFVDIVLFMFVKCISENNGTFYKLILLGFTLLLHIIGAIGSFVVLQRLVGHIVNTKWLDFFSEHSMTIYLVHQQLIYFSNGWFKDVVPPVVLIAINFIFAITVSTLFSLLMSRNKITRLLVGKKLQV